MKRALQLARRGLGRVEPNPMVGCVLVRGGRIVGEGYHRRYGAPHAEVEALRTAGRRARGATAYVNLEPCCHFGKTPPCTEALIQAGIAGVVVAMRDPFPKVNGGGLRRLRQAGVRCEVGLCDAEARELNAPFVTRVTQGRPYVILKWAQSIDGKIATRTGDSRWISGEAARREVHRLRARVDAILVGAETVLRDDPELTARGVPLRRIAQRVVLDSRLRIPASSKVILTAARVPTVVFAAKRGAAPEDPHIGKLRKMGAEVVTGPAPGGRVDLSWVMKWLADRGVTNLLVEGGGEVLGAFLDRRLVDEAWVFVSPRLIGGRDAVGALGGKGISQIQDAPPFRRWSLRRIGRDLIVRLRFE